MFFFEFVGQVIVKGKNKDQKKDIDQARLKDEANSVCWSSDGQERETRGIFWNILAG